MRALPLLCALLSVSLSIATPFIVGDSFVKDGGGDWQPGIYRMDLSVDPPKVVDLLGPLTDDYVLFCANNRTNEIYLFMGVDNYTIQTIDIRSGKVTFTSPAFAFPYEIASYACDSVWNSIVMALTVSVKEISFVSVDPRTGDVKKLGNFSSNNKILLIHQQAYNSASHTFFIPYFIHNGNSVEEGYTIVANLDKNVSHEYFYHTSNSYLDYQVYATPNTGLGLNVSWPQSSFTPSSPSVNPRRQPSALLSPNHRDRSERWKHSERTVFSTNLCLHQLDTNTYTQIGKPEVADYKIWSVGAVSTFDLQSYIILVGDEEFTPSVMRFSTRDGSHVRSSGISDWMGPWHHIDYVEL